jgi:hypothetical protein
LFQSIAPDDNGKIEMLPGWKFLRALFMNNMGVIPFLGVILFEVV